MNLFLIDTSFWVEAVRTNGNAGIRREVYQLIRENKAAWCDVVRLELWNSAHAERDSVFLDRVSQLIPSLPITNEVFELGISLARKARRRGYTIPPTDLLIAACAKVHEVEVKSRDRHFEHLAAVM